jgi:hypothetical protein
MLSPRLGDYEVGAIYVPFDEEKLKLKSKMRIGIWKSDDFYPSSLPV